MQVRGIFSVRLHAGHLSLITALGYKSSLHDINTAPTHGIRYTTHHTPHTTEAHTPWSDVRRAQGAKGYYSGGQEKGWLGSLKSHLPLAAAQIKRYYTPYTTRDTPHPPQSDVRQARGVKSYHSGGGQEKQCLTLIQSQLFFFLYVCHGLRPHNNWYVEESL